MEWDDVMEEASLWKFPEAQRQLAANVIMYNQPVKPEEFLRRHLENLSDDFPENMSEHNDGKFQWVLAKLKDIMDKCNISLKEVNLPEPEQVTSFSKAFSYEYQWDENSLNATYHNQHPMLSSKQMDMFSKIDQSVVKKEGKVFFCDAPGGSGKTFTANTLMAKLRLEGRVCLACASSGIAANSLEGGTTAHTKFKIPIDITEDSWCDIREGTKHAQLIKDAELIIWDEATMMNKDAVNAVERTIRRIRESDDIFGKLTVTFLGDWRQILPVLPHASKAQKIAATLLYSDIWEQVEIIEMADNLRVTQAGGDAEFAQFLLDLGEGKIPTQMINGLEYIQIPNDMLLNNN